MLDWEFVDKGITDRYDNPNLFDPLVYVGLGVSRRSPELPVGVKHDRAIHFDGLLGLPRTALAAAAKQQSRPATQFSCTIRQ